MKKKKVKARKSRRISVASIELAPEHIAVLQEIAALAGQTASVVAAVLLCAGIYTYIKQEEKNATRPG